MAENSEIWCWRRIEKTSWTDRVKNEKVLSSFKERNTLCAIQEGSLTESVTSCVATTFLNTSLKKGKGRIEVKGRRGKRLKQLVDDVKDRIGYLKFAEEALYHPLWRTRFGRGYGLVVWQTED
jgi:hypothetical protein